MGQFINIVRFGGNDGYGGFEVDKFESIVKIAPFLAALRSIPAGNLGIIPEVGRSSYRLGNVSTVFFVEFYIRIGYLHKNFGNANW